MCDNDELIKVEQNTEHNAVKPSKFPVLILNKLQDTDSENKYPISVKEMQAKALHSGDDDDDDEDDDGSSNSLGKELPVSPVPEVENSFAKSTYLEQNLPFSLLSQANPVSQVIEQYKLYYHLKSILSLPTQQLLNLQKAYQAFFENQSSVLNVDNNDISNNVLSQNGLKTDSNSPVDLSEKSRNKENKRIDFKNSHKAKTKTEDLGESETNNEERMSNECEFQENCEPNGFLNTENSSSSSLPIDDDELVRLPVSVLNKKLIKLGLSNDLKMKLKQRRRTLKNRFYAKTCRDRRQTLRENLEICNQKLMSDIKSYSEKVKCLLSEIAEIDQTTERLLMEMTKLKIENNNLLKLHPNCDLQVERINNDAECVSSQVDETTTTTTPPELSTLSQEEKVCPEVSVKSERENLPSQPDEILVTGDTIAEPFLPEQENYLDNETVPCEENATIQDPYEKRESANRLQDDDSTENDLSCFVCGYKADSSANFSLHLKAHSEIKRFNCSLCDFETMFMNCLTEHLKQHSGPNFHKNKTFISGMIKSQTQEHPSVQSYSSRRKVKVYECFYCNYQTNIKEKMRHHQVKHNVKIENVKSSELKRLLLSSDYKQQCFNNHKDRKYKCDKCNFETKKTSKLKLHSLLHK